MFHLVCKGNQKELEGDKSKEKPHHATFLVLCAHSAAWWVEASWALEQGSPRAVPPACGAHILHLAQPQVTSYSLQGKVMPTSFIKHLVLSMRINCPSKIEIIITPFMILKF